MVYFSDCSGTVFEMEEEYAPSDALASIIAESLKSERVTEPYRPCSSVPRSERITLSYIGLPSDELEDCDEV